MQCTSRTFTLDLTEEALKILPLVETFFSTNTSLEFIPRDFIKNTLHHMDYLAWVQNIVRQLPSCINEKYNGFPVISIEYRKKLRKKFKAINIIYKPVKSPEKKIQCYYSQDIWYRNSCGDSKKLSHGFAFECYCCGKLFVRAHKQKRHIENCSGVPGINHSFNRKNFNYFQR